MGKVSCEADMGAEESLLEQGLGRLRELLGPEWEVGEFTTGAPQPANMPRSVRDLKLNHLINIRTGAGGIIGQVLVEVAEDPAPAALSRSVAPRLDLMRRLSGDAAVLVIAPWLSPRTRQVLEELGYGYLDLTGNVWLRLPRMGVFLKTDGQQRDPSPKRREGQQQLRGDKAGWLVRVLVDVSPPYRGTGLAEASRLSLGYVSRLLETMEAQRLIQRMGRDVVDVDWVSLLRERAAAYSLLKAYPPMAMVSQKGIEHTLSQLQRWDSRDARENGRLAVTGSVAAAAVQPVAIGGQLMIHMEADTDNKYEAVRRHLGLLPAASGADVLLLRSANSAAFLGWRLVNGVPHVAMSQLVLDCLGGTGRMPAEGNAVLEYMEHADENSWRLTSLARWGMEPAVG